MQSQSKLPIYGALVANFVIAVIKFIAAGISGSSAMLSEGIHSLVDTGNQLLLLLGISRSKRPADDEHPFGHGKEVYFWTLIVAMLIFAVGGGMSIYEGISHIMHPTEIGDPTWSYAVLGAAIVFEGIVFVIAIKQFNKVKGDGSFWQELKKCKDPTLFAVIFEDAAALMGLVIAMAGIYLGHYFQNPLIDAAASILIGLVLALVAIVMVIESRGLLLGESADPLLVSGVRDLVAKDAEVEASRTPLTMHMSSHEILLALDVEFKAGLNTGQVSAAINRLEKEIKESYPQVGKIYIEAKNFK